jgi:hypothetical protein
MGIAGPVSAEQFDSGNKRFSKVEAIGDAAYRPTSTFLYVRVGEVRINFTVAGSEQQKDPSRQQKNAEELAKLVVPRVRDRTQ